MKRNKIYKIGVVILTIISLPLSAQSDHSPLLARGAGGEALSLSQLLDSAVHHNITLRNAQRSFESAKEQRKEAFTNFFPNISATGFWFNANKGMAETTINPSEVIPADVASSLATSLPPALLGALGNPISVSMMKNGKMAGINAMQPIFAGGQIVNGNKLAKVGEEAASLQLHLSENEVEKNVEQYYWQLLSLQEKMKTLHAVQQMLADIHKDVDVAIRAGVAMRNDLLQVELRQNDTESQQLKVQNAQAVMKMLLAQYCGLSDTTFSLRPVNSDSVSTLPVREDPQQAVLATTEYQLLGKQVEAAKLQKRMAVGEQLPSVALGAGYNYHDMMEKDHSFAMIYATVSVPISGWWGGSHAIKRKKIEYQKALDEQRDKTELLRISIQSAWNSVIEAHQQLAIAQRSIEQAEENLRLNRDCYRAGTSKMSDLLEAQMLYQQAQDKHIDALADYQMKLTAYRQAIGR